MTKLILILMLLVFAFLSGFTYRDVDLGSGPKGVVMALEQTPSKLASVFADTLSSASGDLSPVDTYSNVYAYLKSKYYGTASKEKLPTDDQITYAAIRGMLASLGDRYTRFLDPEQFKQMQEENHGDFQGIGAQLDKKDGEIIIKKPIAKSPAIRAGLKAGDIILKVDDKIIHGMDIEDVVKHIRGERGTKVKLTIKREGVPAPFDVEIIRDVIESPIVEFRMQDEANKIGYLSLAQFNEKSDEQFDYALGELESQGMRGLVLDLRNNPGGLLEICIDIGSRLIKDGNIVIIKQGDGTEERRVKQSLHDHKLGLPLAVLINGNSASASEILAGAIRDHHVGTIIGTDSFGKGLVQTIIPLDNGSAVSITTAKYLTPNLHDVNKEKIHPDIVIEPSDDSKQDVQLDKALQVVREKLGASQTTSGAKTQAKS